MRRCKKTYAICSFHIQKILECLESLIKEAESCLQHDFYFESLSPLGPIMNVSRLNFPKTMGWQSGEKMSRRSCWRLACRDCPLPFYSQTHRYQSVIRVEWLKKQTCLSALVPGKLSSNFKYMMTSLWANHILLFLSIPPVFFDVIPGNENWNSCFQRDSRVQYMPGLILQLWNSLWCQWVPLVG